jgi:hypothetical protein
VGATVLVGFGAGRLGRTAPLSVLGAGTDESGASVGVGAGVAPLRCDGGSVGTGVGCAARS